MVLSILFILYTLNNLAFGLGAIFVPGRMMPNSNDLSPLGLNLLQGLGAIAVATGILAWLARSITDVPALKAITLTFVVATLLTAVVNALAVRSGARPTSQWIFVGVDVAFALAFAYFRFFGL